MMSGACRKWMPFICLLKVMHSSPIWQNYCGLYLALSIIHMCVLGNNKNCASDRVKAIFAYTPTQNSLMCNNLVLIIKLNLGGDWGVLPLNGCVLVLILLVSMLWEMASIISHGKGPYWKWIISFLYFSYNLWLLSLLTLV